MNLIAFASVAANQSITPPPQQVQQMAIPRGLVLMPETMTPGWGVPDIVWLALIISIFALSFLTVVLIKARGLPWYLAWHRGDTHQITALANGNALIHPVKHLPVGADKADMKSLKAKWFTMKDSLTTLKGFRVQLGYGKFGATTPWDSAAANTYLAKMGLGGLKLNRAKDAELIIDLALKMEAGVNINSLMGKAGKDGEIKYSDDWYNLRKICEVIPDISHLEAVAADKDNALTDDERKELKQLIEGYKNSGEVLKKQELDLVCKAQLLSFKIHNIDLTTLNEYFKGFRGIQPPQIIHSMVEEGIMLENHKNDQMMKTAMFCAVMIIGASIVGAIIMYIATMA